MSQTCRTGRQAAHPSSAVPHQPIVCTHFHHFTCRCTLNHGGDGTQITIWRWLYTDETDFHRFASIEILIGMAVT
jgi:hypothetical protein